MRRLGLFYPTVRKLIRSASIALGVLVCAVAAPAAAQMTVSLTVPTTVNPPTNAVAYSTTINPGDLTALLITITNGNTTQALGSVGFNIDLNNPGSGLRVVDGGAGNGGIISYQCFNPGSTTPITGSGTASAPVGGQTVTLSGGVVPTASSSQGQSRCEILLAVTSTTIGGNTIEIPANGVTGNDGSVRSAPATSGQATQTITVNNFIAPTLGKNFYKDATISGSATLGAPRTLRLTITNNAANGVTLPLNGAGSTPAYGLRDILPSGLEVAPTPNTAMSASCNTDAANNPAIFSPAAGATTVQIVGGTIAAGQTCTLQVDVVGTSVGAKNNSISGSGDFASRRGIAAANSPAATLTINSSLNVTTSFQQDPIPINQTGTFRVTFENLGGTPIVQNGPFVDIIGRFDQSETAPTGTPPNEGLRINGTGPTGGLIGNTCTGANIVVDAASRQFYTMTGATFAANSSCTLTFEYQGGLTDPTAGAQTFTHFIFAGAVPNAQGVTSGPATASVNVYNSLLADKYIVTQNGTLIGQNDPAVTLGGGQVVRYKITVGNFGPSAPLVVTDRLPAGMQIVTAPGFEPVYQGDEAACSVVSGDFSTPTRPVFSYPAFPGTVGADARRCDIFFSVQVPLSLPEGTSLANIMDACDFRIGAGATSGGANPAAGTGTCALRGTGVDGGFAAPIAIGQAFSVNTPVPAGSVVTLTYTLSNLGGTTLQNAAFTNTFPAGLTVAPTPNVQNNCGGTFTANAGGNSVSLTNGTVGPRDNGGLGAVNGTCAISVDVTGTAGAYTNVIAASAFTGSQTQPSGPPLAISSAAQPVNALVTFEAALNAAKAFNPSTISSGGLSTVSIVLENNGSGAYNNVSVTDPLPAGMVIAPTPSAATTCGGPTSITAAPGASTFAFAGATLPGGGSCVVTFNVTATGSGNWVNTIPAGNITASGGVQNVTAVTATLTNNSAQSINVTNNTSPSTLTAPGQTAELRVTLQNNGASAVSGISVTQYLRVGGVAGGAVQGVVIAPSPTAQTNCVGGTVQVLNDTAFRIVGAQLGPGGAQCQFSVRVTMLEIGTRALTIPVGAITSNEAVSNTAQASTSLALGGNIGVTKAFTPAVVRPNVVSRLRITLYNLLTTGVSNLTFNDTMPPGVVIAPTPNATTTCVGSTIQGGAAGTTSIGLTGGQLAASTGVAQQCEIEVNVVSAARGAYLNTIPINDVSGVASGGPVNNVVGAEGDLLVADPVVVTKAFANPTRTPGQVNPLTITLTNPNPTALSGAQITDPLPSGVAIAATPAATTTCAGGSVTANPAATSAQLTGGAIPANGFCTVTFNVVSNIPATYTNTIPAGALSTFEGVSSEAPATASFIVRDPPSVAKSFSPAAVPAGGTSQLTIQITNNASNGPATLTAPFVDNLPTSPGPITVAAGAIGGTCNLANVTATVGSGQISLAAGTVVQAGGCSVIVPVTGAINGTHTNTIPSGALQTDVGNNVQPATANLVVSPLGYVTGRVYRDTDNDGVYQPGTDSPIGGVDVTLTGASYGADNVAGGGDDVAIAPQTIQTDATGGYTFFNLTAGSYTVTEPNQPPGTLNGITTSGSIVGAGTAGSASAVGVLPSAISNIVLLFDSGTSTVAGSVNNDFGEILGSTLSGVVFADGDNNGVQDPGDNGIPAVVIELYAGATATGAPVSTTTTDGAGAYAFTGLTPGTYSIRQPNQPAGTSNGQTIAGAVPGGTPGGVTPVGTTPSAIQGIVLPANTTSAGNNFAELTTSTLSGLVFMDLNDNGTQDPGDTGISGVTIQLFAGATATGAPVATTATDVNGAYSFGALTAGVYSIRQPTQPAGTADGKVTAGAVAGGTPGMASAQGVPPSTISNITLPAGVISSGNNFAEVPAGRQIGGHVFLDVDNNGVRDPTDTGLGAVTLELFAGATATGAPVATTTTNASGQYTFTGLGAGAYTVRQPNQPANTLNGVTLAGTTGGTVTAVGVTPSVISGIDLNGANVSSIDNDFGEVAAPPTPGQAVISGRVYEDTNNNGVIDPGERGIQGVTVTLTGVDANGDPVNVATTTDANGDYSFSVPPSDASGYTITETQPNRTDGQTTAPVGAPSSSKPIPPGGLDVIAGVVVGTTNLNGFNFGEGPQGAGVTGVVFADANRNGVRDAGEAGIAGVAIVLSGTSATGAPVSMTTFTDMDGRFVFSNVPPSNGAGYTITQTQPSGFTDGITSINPGQPGSPNSTKAVLVGDQDRIVGVVVPADTSRGDYVFAEIPDPQLKPPIINGYVYFDRDHNRIRPTDGSIQGQAGWTVTLRQNGALICTTTTNERGFYQFDNLHCPGYEVSGLPTGSGFSITFDKADSMFPAVATSGGNRGEVVRTGRQIINITLGPSDQVVEQNLPLDPAGVVYDSLTRAPVSGATVVITGPAGFNPEIHLVGAGPAQTQVVGLDGAYAFLLQSGYPTGVYTLTVTVPAGYLPSPSAAIPACAGALNVGLFPDPALLQANNGPPGTAAIQGCPGLVPGGATNSTQYYFQFFITNGGSAPILNNHIPIDPVPVGALFITKTSPMVQVARGDLVPYTITATNTQSATTGTVTIRDQLPPGFKYRDGTATRNGVRVPADVSTNGFVTWPAETFAPNEKKTYTLMLTVGAGVGDGDYVNRAWGSIPGGNPFTNIAAATVRIVPDPTFDCPDIIGKVFDDRNANGYQDDGEPGIPAVRIATATGLLITTDAEGRFHVPCPAVPDMDRGSNLVLKLDERTLPSGFRVTTENPGSVRITRGKMVKLNFGATVHRVVRVELSDAAFEAGSTNLLADFRRGVDGLPTTLSERPSVVRIAYRPGGESADLVKKRVAAVRDLIRAGWKSVKDRYPLAVEIEEVR